MILEPLKSGKFAATFLKLFAGNFVFDLQLLIAKGWSIPGAEP